MKCAYDFRENARNALRGNWGIAVAAGLLAMLLGGIASVGPKLTLNIEEDNLNLGFQIVGQQFQMLNWAAVGYSWLLIAMVAIALFILANVVGIGYDRFNLTLIDHQEKPDVGVLFGYFPYWKTTTLAALLQMLYIFLWSLLLLVPGVIARYSYAMTGYILAEYPELSPSEAIARSKDMMEGNRWRLFCLEFSFIGWELLCLLTLGIGNLWLVPYRETARTAFYREVSATISPLDMSETEENAMA